MRLSTLQIFNTGTTGIQNRQYDLFKTQTQLSSGRRILTPEDDPIGASEVLEVSQSKGVNTQYMTNQGTAESNLSLLESVMSSVGDELQSIHERAVQAGNGSLDAAQRGMIAEELKQRMNSLVALANTRDGNGLYLFSGFKTNVQPFAVDAAAVPPHSLATNSYVTYSGDGGQQALQVSASLTMATSENGQDVFMQIRDGQGNLTGKSIFDAVQNLVTILDPNSGVSFNNADYTEALGDIMGSLEHVNQTRASVGARLQALDSLTTTAEDNDFLYESRISELQDLDYASAITKLARYQLQLEAAQESFKRTSQLSLFNIL